jgi:hypothetical protein
MVKNKLSSGSSMFLIKSYIKNIILSESYNDDGSNIYLPSKELNMVAKDASSKYHMTNIPDSIKQKFVLYHKAIQQLEDEMQDAYESNLPQEEIDRLEQDYEDLIKKAENELLPYTDEDFDFTEDREQDQEHYAVDYYSLDRELYELYVSFMQSPTAHYMDEYHKNNLAEAIKGIIHEYRDNISSREEKDSLPDYNAMSNDELIEFMTDAYHAHKARLDKKRNKIK